MKYLQSVQANTSHNSKEESAFSGLEYLDPPVDFQGLLIFTFIIMPSTGLGVTCLVYVFLSVKYIKRVCPGVDTRMSIPGIKSKEERQQKCGAGSASFLPDTYLPRPQGSRSLQELACPHYPASDSQLQPDGPH